MRSRPGPTATCGSPTDGGTAPAIGRITPSGQITEFSAGLNSGSLPALMAVGPDGNVWFTDEGCVGVGTCAIGRITPSGQITEFTAGLNSGNSPTAIAAGPDGNLWFGDRGQHPRNRADHAERADHRVLRRPQQRQLPAGDHYGA